MSENNTTPRPQEAPAPETTAAAAPPPDAAKPAEAAAKAHAAAKTARGNTVYLGDDIEIYASKPLPEFDGFAAHAFEAKDKRTTSRQLALLADRTHVPRITYGGSYKNIKHTSLQRLFDLGIVDWPDGRQYLAYVFERPAGRKFVDKLDAKPLQLPEDKLISTLIQPIITLLAEMRNVDMVHGAICLENMYLIGSAGSETVLLGECLTCAPSSRLGAIYEPIERAMAQPMGRGAGLYKDDLYAFGMCVAMIARGENFAAGKSTRQIVETKIEQGSYGMVQGRDRMPGGISEFLRNVLNDDENARWDVDDALRWLEGRRHAPKQPRLPEKASRAYPFHERKFWDMRSLSYAFSNDIAAAAAEIEGGQLEQWIKRNFDDKILETRLERIWDSDKTAAREKVVSTVLMAMDPPAPFRYRKLSIFPSGLGDAMADAYAHGEDVQMFGEVIQQQLLTSWIMQRRDEVPDAANLLSNFEKSRNFIAQKIPGYGMERVLYVLNAEVACMSPMLKNFMVLSPGHLLMALETMAKNGQQNERVFDRHMIAFLSVREAKMIDPHLGHVISHDRGSQMIGIVRTLAAIQKRFTTGPMPGVVNWMIDLMAPALERYLDRDLRRELAKKLEKFKGKGDLSELLEFIDDTAQVQEDNQRYMQARSEYFTLQAEKEKLSNAMKGHKHFGYATGRQTAMLVSAALSALIIVVYLVSRVSGGG